MQLKKIIPLLSLLIIPLISAYNGYSGNLFDYFENEWVMFGTVFVVTFALIYFSLLKTFDEHKGVVSVLSAGLSLFISIALTKKATLYSLTSEGIANWIILIAFIIAALFIFKFIAFRKQADGTRKISWFWFTIAIIIAIIFLIFTDVSELLPESMLYGPIGDFIKMIEGILWIIIPIIIAFFVIKLFWGRGGRGSSGTAPLQPQQQGQSWRQRRIQRQQQAQVRQTMFKKSQKQLPAPKKLLPATSKKGTRRNMALLNSLKYHEIEFKKSKGNNEKLKFHHNQIKAIKNQLKKFQ